jgi:hypothetical protein
MNYLSQKSQLAGIGREKVPASRLRVEAAPVGYGAPQLVQSGQQSALTPPTVTHLNRAPDVPRFASHFLKAPLLRFGDIW